jgi:hypothetical protein
MISPCAEATGGSLGRPPGPPSEEAAPQASRSGGCLSADLGRNLVSAIRRIADRTSKCSASECLSEKLLNHTNRL